MIIICTEEWKCKNEICYISRCVEDLDVFGYTVYSLALLRQI